MLTVFKITVGYRVCNVMQVPIANQQRPRTDLYS